MEIYKNSQFIFWQVFDKLLYLIKLGENINKFRLVRKGGFEPPRACTH